MVRLNARAEIDKVAFADVAREYLGSKVEARRGLWSALFAPDFGRLLAEHLGLVFGSLAIAALIGIPARHAGGARALARAAGAGRRRPAADHPVARACSLS